MDTPISSLPPPRPRAKKKNTPAVFKLRRISSTFGGPISSPASPTHSSSTTPPASPIHPANPPSPLSPRSPPVPSTASRDHPRCRRLSVACHGPLEEYPLQTATFGPSFPPATPTLTSTHHRRPRSEYYPQPQDTIQRRPSSPEKENGGGIEKEEVKTVAVGGGAMKGKKDNVHFVEVLLQDQPLALPTRPLVHTPAIWTSSISALEERREEEDVTMNSMFMDLTEPNHGRSPSWSSTTSSSLSSSSPSSSLSSPSPPPPSSPWSSASPKVLTPPPPASHPTFSPTSPTLSTFSHAQSPSPLITARTSSLTSASMSLLSSSPNSQQQQSLCRKSSAMSAKSQALSLHSIKAFVLGNHNSPSSSSNNNNNNNNICQNSNGNSTAFATSALSPTTLSPYAMTTSAQQSPTSPSLEGSRHKKTPSAVSAASFFSAFSLASPSSGGGHSLPTMSPPSSRASTPRPKSTQVAKMAFRARTPPMLLPPLMTTTAVATTTSTTATTTCCLATSSSYYHPHHQHLSPTSPTPISIPTSPLALTSPSPRSPVSTASKWTSAEDPLMGSYYPTEQDSSASSHAHEFSNDFLELTKKQDAVMTSSTSSSCPPSSLPVSDIEPVTTINHVSASKIRGKKDRQRSECKFCSFFRIC